MDKDSLIFQINIRKSKPKMAFSTSLFWVWFGWQKFFASDLFSRSKYAFYTSWSFQKLNLSLLWGTPCPKSTFPWSIILKFFLIIKKQLLFLILVGLVFPLRFFPIQIWRKENVWRYYTVNDLSAKKIWHWTVKINHLKKKLNTN